MMVTRVISNNGLRVTDDGVDIEVRLPWYRSLPLSVVDIVDVRLDGVKIDPTRIRFEVDGEIFRIDEMRSLTSKWWYVLDSGFLHVTHASAARGSIHNVDITVGVTPPYINSTRLVHGNKDLRAA